MPVYGKASTIECTNISQLTLGCLDGKRFLNIHIQVFGAQESQQGGFEGSMPKGRLRCVHVHVRTCAWARAAISHTGYVTGV